MRVLVIEDEPVIALNVQTILLDIGHRPIMASSIAEATTILKERHFDVAILDVSLPDGNSFEFAAELRNRNVPFVFATGRYIEGQPSFADIPVLEKPFDLTALEAAVVQLAEQIVRR